jgi:hypothetical protein
LHGETGPTDNLAFPRQIRIYLDQDILDWFL